MLKIQTQNPQWLLDAIKKAIVDKKVETWECDSDGDFTHKPEQWRAKGWLHPEVGVGVLTLKFLGRKDTAFDIEVYAVYVGRFSEMLLAHFPSHFQSANGYPRTS